MKPCRVCGLGKPLSEFYRRKNGRVETRCKPCVMAHSRAQYWRDPESKKAYVREHRKTYDVGAVRQRRLARGRKRYHANREYEAERSRRYHQANRERWRDYAAAWRTRRGSDTAATQARIRELLMEPCAYCGGTKDIEVDHIVPLSRGGQHEPLNLASACRFCNRSKGARLLSEWRVAA